MMWLCPPCASHLTASLRKRQAHAPVPVSIFLVLLTSLEICPRAGTLESYWNKDGIVPGILEYRRNNQQPRQPILDKQVSVNGSRTLCGRPHEARSLLWKIVKAPQQVYVILPEQIWFHEFRNPGTTHHEHRPLSTFLRSVSFLFSETLHTGIVLYCHVPLVIFGWLQCVFESLLDVEYGQIAQFSPLSSTVPLSPGRPTTSLDITTINNCCLDFQYRGDVGSMIDSPISVLSIALFLSLSLDIIYTRRWNVIRPAARIMCEWIKLKLRSRQPFRSHSYELKHYQLWRQFSWLMLAAGSPFRPQWFLDEPSDGL